MMTHRAAFLITGSEILDGRVIDSNSAYLASELLQLGIRVFEIVKVGDEVGRISSRLKALMAEYDLVVVSGGLGPTSDDLTRDAVAAAVGEKLVVFPEELKRLESYMKSRSEC